MEGYCLEIVAVVHLSSLLKIGYARVNINTVAVNASLLLNIVSSTRNTEVRRDVKRVAVIPAQPEANFDSLLCRDKEDVFVVLLHVIAELLEHLLLLLRLLDLLVAMLAIFVNACLRLQW